MPTDEDFQKLQETLNKERTNNEALTKKIKSFEDAKALSEKTLQEQVQALQKQIADLTASHEAEKNQLQGQLIQRDIRTEFSKAFRAAKVHSRYEDMIYSHLSGQIEQGADGKFMLNGKSLDAVAAEYKTTLPDMFEADVAASGSGSAPGAPVSTPSAQVVRSSDLATIQGLNPADVASGKVVIQPD